LQFAQNTSSANAITIKAGSYIQAFKTGGADLAEAYSSKDLSITPGDIVSVDGTLENGVQKSIKQYDPTVLGIVSTKPGMILGDSAGIGAPVLVALSGRVPVKVSTENGAIKAGDYLTTSSIPGVAMKATKAGVIIGTAMVDYNGEGIGKVVAFVKNGSSLGSNSDDVNKGIDLLTQLLADPISNSSDLLNASGAATNSAELANNTSTIETNLVGYVSKVVTNMFKNVVEFFGNVIFHADVTFLGRPTFNSDTGGFAVINTGAHEVTINFDKEYQNTPIVIGSPDTAVLYSITDVSTKGFKIKLTQVEKQDIKFSWTATAVKDAKTSVGTAPTPTPEAGTPIPTEIPTVVSPSSTSSVTPTEIPSITPSSTESSPASSP
jgi:hypothetical protein